MDNIMKTALYFIIALLISNAIKLHTVEYTVLQQKPCLCGAY